MGIFLGFWPVSQKVFNMGLWNLVYRHISGTFMCVQKAPVGQIVGSFLAQIGPK